jgi:hypothetical protein
MAPFNESSGHHGHELSRIDIVSYRRNTDAPRHCSITSSVQANNVDQRGVETSLVAVLSVSLWFTFSAMEFSGSPNGDGILGTAMDSTALRELIAQIRGTVTAVAEAEQKLAAVKAELSQQEHGAKLDASAALLKAVKPAPKHGWLPAMD